MHKYLGVSTDNIKDFSVVFVGCMCENMKDFGVVCIGVCVMDRDFLTCLFCNCTVSNIPLKRR